MSKYMDGLFNMAQKTVDRGKDKLDEVLLQNRLDKVYRQLGALAYTLEKTGQQNEELLAHYVQEIDRLKSQLDLMRPLEPEPISTYECPSCGRGVAKDAMFCGGCGAELPRG